MVYLMNITGFHLASPIHLKGASHSPFWPVLPTDQAGGMQSGLAGHQRCPAPLELSLLYAWLELDQTGQHCMPESGDEREAENEGLREG